MKTSADIPQFVTDLPVSRDMIQGEKLELTVEAVAEDQGNISYEWYKNGRLLEGETDETLVIDSFKEEDEGIYQVRAVNTIDDSIVRVALGSSCTVSSK